jgi:hemolysin activation/secretion protein
MLPRFIPAEYSSSRNASPDAATPMRMLGLAMLRARCLCAIVLLVAGAARTVPAIATAAAGSQDPPPAASTAARRNSNPVHVERIAIRGNRALRSRALQAVAAPYLGRDLGDADIEDLREALTRRYTDHGFVNSVVTLDPNAPFHDGVLSFLAIEGRIDEVRVHGLDGLRESYVIDRVRGSEDETLNTDVLRERLLRLSEDPLFARVNSAIDPGSDLSHTILDVDVERARPYSLTVALNNYRPPEIGEKAYDVSAQVRDVTGFGDVVDADVSGPLASSGGLGYGLDWQLPFDHYGSVATVSVAKINTVVTAEPLSALDVRSTIERQEFKLTQPLWSAPGQQFTMGASVAHEQESTQADALYAEETGMTEGATRSLTVRLLPEYSYRSPQQYLSVQLTWLHADLLDYPSGPPSDLLPDQHYSVWTGQLHHVWDLAAAPFELESRALLQRTDARISDLHEQEIGGINSVRGFREDDLLVGNVVNANVDFRWLALRAASQRDPSLALGTFFDWAAGYDVGEPTDTFSSCGITFRLKWSKVKVDFAYGVPLVRPGFVSGQHGSWQDHGIHVQIATTL